MWSVRIATGCAVLVAAMASASAQTARTTSPGAPLSLLGVNQGPIVDPSPVVTDKPASKTPPTANTKANKATAATPSQPAPIGTAAAPRATTAWPVTHADAQNPTRASPSAPPPASLPAKSAAKTVGSKPAGDNVFDWNQANALGFAAAAPKEPAHLVAPSASAQPERPSAAVVPAPQVQPSVTTMVAEPEPSVASPQGVDASSVVQILGTLSGGAVGGAIVWYLAGAGLKRGEREETERPRGYNWTSAHDNGWDDSTEREEVDQPRHRASAHDNRWGDSRERVEADPPWRHNRASVHDNRWDDSRDWEETDPPWRHNRASAYDDRWNDQ
jgi:hypothetical protein